MINHGKVNYTIVFDSSNPIENNIINFIRNFSKENYMTQVSAIKFMLKNLSNNVVSTSANVEVNISSDTHIKDSGSNIIESQISSKKNSIDNIIISSISSLDLT